MYCLNFAYAAGCDVRTDSFSVWQEAVLPGEGTRAADAAGIGTAAASGA